MDNSVSPDAANTVRAKSFPLLWLILPAVLIACVFSAAGYLVGIKSIKAPAPVSIPSEQAVTQTVNYPEKGFGFATDSALENPLTLKVSSSEWSIVPFSSSLIENKVLTVYPTFYKGALYHEFFLSSVNDPRYDSIYMERINWNGLENITDEYKGQISGSYENYGQTPIKSSIDLNKDNSFVNKNGIVFYWKKLGGSKSYASPSICMSTDYLTKTDTKISYKLEVCKNTPSNNNNETSLSDIQAKVVENGLTEIADTFSSRR